MPLVVMKVAPTVPMSIARQQDDVSGRQRHEQRARGQPQAAGGDRHAGRQAVGDHPGRNIGEDARQGLRRKDQPELGVREPKFVANHHEQGARSGGHDGRHRQDGENRDEVGAGACHERAGARAAKRCGSAMLRRAAAGDW